MRAPPAARRASPPRFAVARAPRRGFATAVAFLLTIVLAIPTHAQDTRGFLARLLQPGSPTSPPPNATSPGLTAPPNAPVRPDPRLTPGDTLDVTLEDIRTPGYSARVRNVPISVKREVYAAYGIARWTKGEYEVDHLIPLSLGGSNSKRNLWPESYLTDPLNAHVKDRLEYRLLKLVRAGSVDLKVAQQAIAKDWIAAYQKYVGPLPTAGQGKGGTPRVAVTASQGAPNPDLDGDGQPDLDPSDPVAPSVPAKPTTGQLGPDARPDTTTTTAASSKVWVNTKSGAFHRAGSRYYGKTKQGKFMGEADAVAAGFHAAGSN